MTQPRARFRAFRLTAQFATLGMFATVIVGGCSDGVKTVTTVDCPLGGATASGGQAPQAGSNSDVAGSSNAAGQPTAEAGQAGASSEGEAGASGADVGGSGGKAGAGGSAGKTGSAGTAGKGSANGGSGNTAGSGGMSTGGSGGAPLAVCGDNIVTPPEFCDDKTNTDLSYGCYACTTLPPTAGSAGNAPQQCTDCLQSKSHPTSCYGCKDYRACYACLRKQPNQGLPGVCNSNDGDDVADDDFTPKKYSDRCFDPNNKEYQTATGGPAGGTPRGLVCQALVSCVLRTKCMEGSTLFMGCYCGLEPKSSTSCIDPAFVPHGPCVNEITNAAAPGPSTKGGDLTLYISTAIGDASPGQAWSALGVAFQITSCAAEPSACRDVCFPDAGGVGGSGGVGGTP